MRCPINIREKITISIDSNFNIKILASDFYLIIYLETGRRINKSDGVRGDNHTRIGLGEMI